ncbi:MAG: hypothetical protein KIS78_28550 [Labilithrix sp.]|nr:hypothetical protein [Labilithrix sp.]
MQREVLPFVATGEDEVELAVVDLGVARALWEGVPSARLLARIRLHRDERDLVDLDQRASGVDFDDASWDITLARLLAAAPASLDRLKRAVARHARAASDEGSLAAGEATIAALVHAHLAGSDADASPAEGANEAGALEDSVRVACGRFDDRLGRASGGRTGVYFEACLELARRASAPAWPLDALRSALGGLAAIQEAAIHDSGGYPKLDALPEILLASGAPLYPWAEDGDVPVAERRACLLDRASLERVLLVPERDLAALVSRASARYPGLPIEKIVADVSSCLTKHGALLLVATREPRSQREAPRLPPASWAPADLDATETALTLASALERGSLTAPRARAVLLRGGDAALDAIGKEMLNVAAHPFASAVFAELLAPFARERDVVRLVTYFAIAPDPRAAARALDLCSAREVVSTVLEAWLTTMLPADGALAEPGDDPDTSASARVASCIEALRPYPALYQVVEPLLSRLSELPASF